MIPMCINMVHYKTAYQTKLRHRPGEPWNHIQVSAWKGKSFQKYTNTFCCIKFKIIITSECIGNVHHIYEFVYVIPQKTELCLRLQLHGAIYRADSFVLMLRYCANLKEIRYESTSLSRIVADKSHRVIAA